MERVRTRLNGELAHGVGEEDVVLSTISCRAWRRALPLVVVLLVVMVGLLGSPMAAYAQTPTPTPAPWDPIDQGCMADIAGFAVNCNANDIEIASVTSITILDDGCAYPGDTVTFTADYLVQLNAQTRYDAALYFARDGDPNGDGAESGLCTAATLPYTPAPPYYDGDGDLCGDINSTVSPLSHTVTLTVMCVDDGTGQLELPYGISWDNNAGGYCASAADAAVGTPSKCKSDEGYSVPITVPKAGYITIIKDLYPADDPGLFNLLIDGTARAADGGDATDVGDGGTTGMVTVGAGTLQDPGASHTVGESVP